MIDAHMVTAAGKIHPIRQSGETLVIDGQTMRVSETETATHTVHTWLLGGQKYLIVKIKSPVTVHFESDTARSPDYGPFEAVWLLDGWLFPDLEQKQGLAQFRYEEKDWMLAADQARWQRVVFTNAR